MAIKQTDGVKAFLAGQAELRALGLSLVVAAGEYKVNFRTGNEATAYYTGDLADATDHAHMHIIASRINPDTGRAYSDKDDFKKVGLWALEYEQSAGVVRCPAREAIDPNDHEKLLAAVTRDRSTFARSDLTRLLSKSLTSRAACQERATEILAMSEVIGLRDTADAGVTRYTTRAVLATERQVIRDAGKLAVDTSHGLSDRRKAETIDRHPRRQELERDKGKGKDHDL